MFCPQCGTPNSDQNFVCISCGAPLKEGAAAAPAATGMKVKKNKYLATVAPKNVKNLGFAVWILTLVCALAMILSVVSVRNTSLEDIPFVSAALTISGFNYNVMDEAKEELEEGVEELEDILDEYEDELSDREMEILEDTIDAFGAFAKDCSVANFDKILNVIENFDRLDDDLLDDLNINLALDDLYVGKKVIETASTVFNTLLIVSMLLALVWTLFGGGFRNIGLIITGMIFSIFYTLILCGTLYFLLVLAIHIAMIVLVAKINKAYKAYKNAPLVFNAQPANV